MERGPDQGRPVTSAKGTRAWYAEQQKRVLNTPLAGKVEFGGELEKDQKIAMLDGSTVLCVPTSYAGGEGASFVLEALAPRDARRAGRRTGRSPS